MIIVREDKSPLTEMFTAEITSGSRSYKVFGGPTVAQAELAARFFCNQNRKNPVVGTCYDITIMDSHGPVKYGSTKGGPIVWQDA